MSVLPKSNINVVFGAMTIGKPGIEMTRVHTYEATADMLDLFRRFGHIEIDTARLYGQGSSEEYLGEVGWRERGMLMDTKLYPNRGHLSMATESYSHSPEDLRLGLMRSLKALKTDKINMWYLHGPDRQVPFEDTLREVNKLHKEGYFERFGVSNYMSWEVAQMCEICEKHGWIKPGVYQGVYNAFQRSIEPELFPCLRKYGIALFAFQPLAGGFLTERYHRDKTDFEEGSRFDPKKLQGQLHHGRYWNDAYFDALETLRSVSQVHGLSEAECGLRWLAHHSEMKKKNGDAVIIGASSSKQLEQNLIDLEKGPLPEDVVQALSAGWQRLSGVQKYWH